MPLASDLPSNCCTLNSHPPIILLLKFSASRFPTLLTNNPCGTWIEGEIWLKDITLDCFLDDEADGVSWGSKTSSASLSLSASPIKVWNAWAKLCHNNVHSWARRQARSYQRDIWSDERCNDNPNCPLLLSFDQRVGSDISQLLIFTCKIHRKKCRCCFWFHFSDWYVHWCKMQGCVLGFLCWVT